ncbi:MAG: hypothetical protein GXY84_02110 [Clostridiales bacterium]|nr:hypothetical protein [Clostridiales bacterium]
MKYHIDTIPVWDAMHLDSECPLCALRRSTERLLISRSLGASVMSPDTRIRVNDLGFCPQHHQMMHLQPGGNRLGHGLMMLSHLQTLRPRVSQALKAGGGQGQGGGFSRLFRRQASASVGGGSPLQPLCAGCTVCEELETQSKRQAASLLHLWNTEAAFREAFLASKGLCLPHTELTLAMSGELLSGERLASYAQAAGQLLEDSLTRLEEELAWFTQKFDYRNAQKDWGTSRDALERVVNKLRGWCLGPEPMQDEQKA